MGENGDVALVLELRRNGSKTSTLPPAIFVVNAMLLDFGVA